MTQEKAQTSIRRKATIIQRIGPWVVNADNKLVGYVVGGTKTLPGDPIKVGSAVPTFGVITDGVMGSIG